MINASAAPVDRAGSRGRPKEDREMKKRISLSILPILYEDIQKIAYVQLCAAAECERAAVCHDGGIQMEPCCRTYGV